VTLVSISTAEHPSVTKTVSGFTAPVGLAAAPDVAPTAHFTVTVAVPASPATFDASTSTPGSRPIASYAWTFGDGSSTLTTTAPTLQHTFAPPGDHVVSLTLTDEEGGTSGYPFTTGQTTALDDGPQAGTSQNVGFADPARSVLAYVTANIRDVAVIDTTPLTASKVLGNIPVASAIQTGETRTTYPQGIAASPTLSRIYVDVSQDGSTSGAMDVIEAATNTVDAVVPATSSHKASAISPDGKTLYVAASDTSASDGASALQVVRPAAAPAAASVSQTITLPGDQYVPTTRPGAVAAGDGGARVAVATTIDGIGNLDVFVATPTTGALKSTAPTVIRFQDAANAVSVDPAATTVAYAVQEATTASGAGPVDQHDGAVITLVHPAMTPREVTLPTGTSTVLNIAVDPAGTTLAVTLRRTRINGLLDPLAIPSGDPQAPVPGAAVSLGTSSNPIGLAFLPDGTGLFTVNLGTTDVSVLDTVTKVVATISPDRTDFKHQGVDPTAITMGQAPPPHVTPPPPTTTTTTTTTAPPTTTTTTTTITTTTTAPPTSVASTVTQRPVATQLAFAGDNVAPWLWLGGTLVLAGGLPLAAVDVRRRYPAWRRRGAQHGHR
jgi:hypothetical protein